MVPFPRESHPQDLVESLKKFSPLRPLDLTGSQIFHILGRNAFQTSTRAVGEGHASLVDENLRG